MLNALNKIEKSLPTLKGTEKQIAYANRLRAIVLDSCKSDGIDGTQEFKDKMEYIFKDVFSKSSANFWINRQSQALFPNLGTEHHSSGLYSAYISKCMRLVHEYLIYKDNDKWDIAKVYFNEEDEEKPFSSYYCGASMMIRRTIRDIKLPPLTPENAQADCRREILYDTFLGDLFQPDSHITEELQAKDNDFKQEFAEKACIIFKKVFSNTSSEFWSKRRKDYAIFPILLHRKDENSTLCNIGECFYRLAIFITYLKTGTIKKAYNVTPALEYFNTK
jgi:hypothetical protein